MSTLRGLPVNGQSPPFLRSAMYRSVDAFRTAAGRQESEVQLLSTTCEHHRASKLLRQSSSQGGMVKDMSMRRDHGVRQ